MARPERRPDDHEGAARLLDRLLTDPVLRARFRNDPAAVARESQLDGLAGDFGEGSAMQTLEARESRSSLAGVMMAAALEGIAGVGLGHASAAHAQGLPPEVDRVLARHQAGAVAPAGPTAEPDDLGLATPDDLAPDSAGVQPAGWSPAGGGADAGVYP